MIWINIVLSNVIIKLLLNSGLVAVNIFVFLEGGDVLGVNLSLSFELYVFNVFLFYVLILVFG